MTSSDRVKPTPETAAKLTPDPLERIKDELISSDDRLRVEEAIGNILSIHRWLFSQLDIKPLQLERMDWSPTDLPLRVAKEYSERYVPWMKRNPIAPQVVELIVDRTKTVSNPQAIADCLLDYK